MNIVITTTLALLQTLAPQVTSSLIAQRIIDALVALAPVIIKGFQEGIPIVQNIISTLRGSDVLVPEQIIQLKAISAVVDAAYDEAFAKAESEEAAAGA